MISFKAVNEHTPNLSAQAHSVNPIGVFDSGVGGLSIFHQIQLLLPFENILYIADQAHVPYGTRTREEIRLYSDAIIRFFLANEVKLTVIACNTASAAALHSLREKYPDHTFVGMEPAVKPAVQATHTRRVGVLATQATFQGELYASVLERFAKDVKVFENTCPGLVSQIEKGALNSPDTRRILEAAIHPMLEQGVDTIVLGCTHYPFVIPLIREIAGVDVDVIDPAPAIARQTKRLLEDKRLLNLGLERGQVTLFSTDSPENMQFLLPSLIGEEMAVQPLKWQSDNQGLFHLIR
jgi:glutamate racemase